MLLKGDTALDIGNSQLKVFAGYPQTVEVNLKEVLVNASATKGCRITG